MRLTATLIVGLCAAANASAFPTVSRSVLKAFFETGDKPTESQFGSLIDSNLAVSPDGVEYEDWAGTTLRSTNPDYDSSLESMSTMDAIIVSTGGGLNGLGLAERTMTYDFSFSNDQGIWVADSLAVFRSLSQETAIPLNQTLLWSLDAPVTFSLSGGLSAGPMTLTGETTIETTLLPAPASGLLLVGGLLAVRRRR